MPLRIERVKPPGRDPVWVFAPQTVGNIDALYKLYGPGWLHDWISAEWQRQSWLSLQRWEFIALPLIIAIAVCVFLGLRVRLRRARQPRTPGLRAAQALRAARTPLALLARGAAAAIRDLPTSSPSRRRSRPC